MKSSLPGPGASSTALGTATRSSSRAAALNPGTGSLGGRSVYQRMPGDTGTDHPLRPPNSEPQLGEARLVSPRSPAPAAPGQRDPCAGCRPGSVHSSGQVEPCPLAPNTRSPRSRGGDARTPLPVPPMRSGLPHRFAALRPLQWQLTMLAFPRAPRSRRSSTTWACPRPARPSRRCAIQCSSISAPEPRPHEGCQRSLALASFSPPQ